MNKNKIIILISMTCMLLIGAWVYIEPTKDNAASPTIKQKIAINDIPVSSNNTLINAMPVIQVSERPTYITEMEWQVLQQLAQQKPPYEETLVHLVNNLRFVKQVELWHSLVKTTEAQALAELLLADIPTRVQQQNLDQQQAQQLQQELINALTVDANARHQRIKAEAQRIGVTIEIESH